MDYSPPGSSVHGISQARILEWVAISFSRESSLPRDRTGISHITGSLPSEILYHLSYQGDLFTIAVMKTSAQQQMTGLKRCDIYTQRNITQHKKEWNIAIWSNMDGPREYHTKWSKSGRERQNYMIRVKSKKITQVNLYTKQTLTHRNRKQPYGYQMVKGWEKNKLGVQFSCSVVSDSSRPHRLQHARLPYPLPTPGACSNSCPSSWWCHPMISSSVVSFSFCLQSFPALGSFQKSQLFTSSGQSTGVLDFHLSFGFFLFATPSFSFSFVLLCLHILAYLNIL